MDDYPHYFALDTEPKLFNINKACVCFFKDEYYIDKIDGIYNAIIYKNITLLKYYKNRYKNVKYFVPVDYSLNCDFDEVTLKNNLRRQTIVYLWFTFELNAIVYPLMTYGDESTLEWCFNHIMKGSNVCVSLKMVARGPSSLLFKKALKKMIDIVKPKALLIYTVASKDKNKELLLYAYECNIRCIVIPNTLLIRNRGIEWEEK